MPCPWRKRNRSCLLSFLFCAASSFFSPSPLYCCCSAAIRTWLTKQSNPGSSNQTIMGVYPALSLTGNKWDLSMHYLKVKFNSSIQGAFDSIIVSLPGLSWRGTAAGFKMWDLIHYTATAVWPVFSLAARTFHGLTLPLYICLEYQWVKCMPFDDWEKMFSVPLALNIAEVLLMKSVASYRSRDTAIITDLWVKWCISDLLWRGQKNIFRQE